MMQVVCRLCKFSNIHRDDEDDGQCHRHAPMPRPSGIMGEDDVDTAFATVEWPYVRPGDWCGDGEVRA